jgi:prevent-host-death family protein
MRSMPAGEFKAKCLALMDEIQSGGESIVVTKRGKPVVRVTPLEPAPLVEKRPTFGAMRGMAVIAGDIVASPFSDEEWKRMEDESFAGFEDERPA